MRSKSLQQVLRDNELIYLLPLYIVAAFLQRLKARGVLHFAGFDSLVCIVARSKEKCHSLSLAPFIALSFASVSTD